MKRSRTVPVLSLALGFVLVSAALVRASDIDTSVIDASAPTGAVSLEAGQQGSIQIAFSVTGKQSRTCEVSYFKEWTLSGGVFTGSNAGSFTVGPREALDPPTTFGPFNGNLSVSSGHATGTFTLAVQPTIGTCTGTGANLALGDPSNYAVTVVPPADPTPPVISPSVSGTLGANGWYTSDVTVTWSVTDAQSAISTSSGCGPTTITSDTTGTELICSATSAGGSASESVTIKRDATLPTITASLSQAPNGAGWHQGDVTVSFSCSDATSLIDPSVGCPADEVVSGDGEHLVSGSTKDLAGLEAQTSITVLIDGTNPTIVGSRSPAANGNGWNNGPVTVHFECADGSGSGIASCTGDQVLSSEGAGQSVQGTAADVAGNQSSTMVGDINIDLTDPTIAYVGQSPLSNGNGWTNVDTTLTWQCDDALSGPASPTVEQILGEGANQSATGICEDLAGNSASHVQTGINVDETPPTITMVSRTPADQAGWNRGPVTVSWTCEDDLSGVMEAAIAVVVAQDGADQQASATCEDLAGNTASDTEGDIDIDTVAPVITDDGVSGGTAGDNGWYTSAVTNAFSASDETSGLADPGDPSFTRSSGNDEGSSVKIASGPVSDVAGNTNPGIDSDAFMIDLSDPHSVAFEGGPADGGSYVFGTVPAAPTCTASDDVSGLAGCGVTGYGTGVGTHTLVATATDNAGRTATLQRTYTVEPWTLNGFFSPVDMGGVWNIVRNGATVPLKFEVFARTTELTDVAVVDSFVAKGVTCPGANASSDDVEFTTTGGTTLRYDATAGQFIQNWQTPKKPGNCYAVTMTTDDGSTITANFKLK
jgi:hypothetical protein